MKNFFVGFLTGLAVMHFVEFCILLMNRGGFELVAVYIFFSIWILLLLLDIGSFIYIRHLKAIHYKTIDVKYKTNGKTYTIFKNITNYIVDDYGRMTFVDNDGIIHYTVYNWKIVGHSEK